MPRPQPVPRPSSVAIAVVTIIIVATPVLSVGVSGGPSLDEGLYGAASASTGGRHYLFGGFDAQRDAHDAVLELDLSTGDAVQAGTMPDALVQGGAAAVGGVVYHVGGATGAAVASRDVLRFDPATGEVTPVVSATMPVGLIGPAVVAYKGRIVIAGGFTLPPTDDTWVDDVWTFDPSDGLTRAASVKLPTGRAYMASATDGDRIWFLGGFGVDPQSRCGVSVCVLRDILEYDPGGETLRVVASLPFGLRWTASAYHDRLVYLIGGCTNNCDAFGASDAIVVFDPATRTAQAIPPRLPHRGGRASFFQAGDTVTIAGGVFESGGTETVSTALVSVLLGVTPPWAPVSVRLANTPDGVEVAWAATGYDGGRGPVRYEVLRAPVGGPLQIVATTQQTSFVDRQAPFGTTVEYTVRAVGGTGLSSPNSPLLSITPVRVPGRPAGILAQGGDGKVVVQWLPPAGAEASGVRAYRVTCPECPEDLRSLEVNDPFRTRATVQPLPNGLAVAFQVRALNDQGEGPPTTEAAAMPSPVPDAPTDLRASVSAGAIRLEWHASPSVDVTAYRLLRGESLANLTTIGDVGAAESAFTDPSPPPGTALLYAAAALRGSTVSPYSNVVRSAIADIPGAPGEVWVRLDGVGVLVGWSPAASDGGSALLGYEVYRSVDGETTPLGVPKGPPLLDDGPPSGIQVRYLVAAVNAAGAGPRAQSEPIVVPPADARTPPFPVLSVDPPAGDTGTTFTFDGAGSLDDEGVVAYRFDFGDGTSTGWTPLASADHRYATAGEYAATLSVRDTLGTTSKEPAVKIVGVGRGTQAEDIPGPPDDGGGVPLPVWSAWAAVAFAAAALRRRR